MKRLLSGQLTVIGVLATVLLLLAAAAAAADFDGNSRFDPAVFRGSVGLWAVPGITRFYFGSSGDAIAPGDYTGDGVDEAAIYRPATGLWSVRNVTRTYLGSPGDVPVSGGGGQRTIDYVVKPGDGADLKAALESTVYRTVSIPAGTYYVASAIAVTHVTRIAAQSSDAVIQFTSANAYLLLQSARCQVENLNLYLGGSVAAQRGAFYLDQSGITLTGCRSYSSDDDAFECSINGEDAVFINCGAYSPARSGFAVNGAIYYPRLTACMAFNCGGDAGFHGMSNLTSCVVLGENATDYGFYQCNNISACQALSCESAGFYSCSYLSACLVDGNTFTDYGFSSCNNLSSCHTEDLSGAGAAYSACQMRDLESCD